MGQATLTQDRRLSGFARADRRQLLARRDGRQADEERRPDPLLLVPCPACGIAWASLRSTTLQETHATATYLCPRCGHLEPVVTVACRS
jgi:predicted RNA-binding Zn-ribbon protein involved in translation (DUF1610 family)